MASTIKLKNGSGAPTSGQLVQGEPALDLTNKRLYTENASGTVIEVGTNPSSLTTASADINGGTIDGTVIGGSSAAAGSFTTISASGEIAANGGVALPDSGQASFGAGDDLKIYHTGSHSYIDENGTGNLYIGSNNGGGVYIQGSGENLASFIDDGAVTLYYDNASKLTTTSTGIDVTGTVTADGLTVEQTSSGANVSVASFQNDGSGANTKADVDFYAANTKYATIAGGYGASAAEVDIKVGNPPVRALTVKDGGDISFYDTSGSSAKFFWDASAESLGIGTTSPSTLVHLQSSLDTLLKIESTDTVVRLDLTDSGGTSLIQNTSGKLVLQADNANASANSYLGFEVDGTERARLDADGNLLVGTTSDGGVGHTLKPSGQHRLNGSGTGGFQIVQFSNDNGQVGNISTSGTSTTYNTSSDQRLKENIVDAPSSSDDIDAIQVRSFDWKADGSHQKYGMIAQELMTVAPEAVSGDPDSDEMMGVDYSKLVPMLIKEIQSLRARVAQLETN